MPKLILLLIFIMPVQIFAAVLPADKVALQQLTAANVNQMLAERDGDLLPIAPISASRNYLTNTANIGSSVYEWKNVYAKRFFRDGVELVAPGAGAGDTMAPSTHAANYVPQWNGTPDSKTLVEGFPITSVGKTLINKSTTANMVSYLGITSGTGDTISPATNTADYIPQWNGTNSKTLKNGLPVAAFGSGWLNLSTAASGRTSLGLGSAATANITSAGNTLINQTSTANMVSYLGVSGGGGSTLSSLGIPNHNLLTVTAGGYVGVNDSTPQYQLSSNGNVGVTGNIYITGDVLNNSHGTRVIHCSGAASSVTGTTAETTLSSWTVPAGAMGANGQLEVILIFTCTYSANNKVYKFNFGGTNYYARTKDNDRTFKLHIIVQNTNSASGQVGFSPYACWENSPDVNITSSVNTASAVTCTVTGQLGNSSDTVTLVSVMARINK